MKRPITIAIALLGCMLVGCASNSELAKSGYESEYDVAKMNQITQRALLDGHRIVWVHPPVKKPK